MMLDDNCLCKKTHETLFRFKFTDLEALFQETRFYSNLFTFTASLLSLRKKKRQREAPITAVC